MPLGDWENSPYPRTCALLEANHIDPLRVPEEDGITLSGYYYLIGQRQPGVDREQQYRPWIDPEVGAEIYQTLMEEMYGERPMVGGGGYPTRSGRAQPIWTARNLTTNPALSAESLRRAIRGSRRAYPHSGWSAQIEEWHRERVDAQQVAHAFHPGVSRPSAGHYGEDVGQAEG